MNYEKIREKYKETPEVKPEPNNTFLTTLENIEIRQNKSIFVNRNKK